jgi:hypothetical protein
MTPKQKAIQARLGVVDKLRELQRDERRLLRRIELMCGEAQSASSTPPEDLPGKSL